MKHLKLYLLAATAFLLCAVAVACQVNLNKSPSENSSDTATTSSPILSDGFRVDLYEKKVENVLHARLLTATEEERINVVVIYDTPSQEQIDAVIEERWQIMRSIQSGSIPSQETTYTLPTEGDGIPQMTLSRDGENVVVIMLDRAMSQYVPYMMNERPELAKQYGVTAAPTLVIITGDSIEKIVNVSNVRKFADSYSK